MSTKHKKQSKYSKINCRAVMEDSLNSINMVKVVRIF